MVKQLKNRYNDPTVYKRFIVGIDRAKINLKKLYDCEQTAQTDMVDSGQDEEYTYEDKPKKSFDGFNLFNESIYILRLYIPELSEHVIKNCMTIWLNHGSRH